MTINDLFSSIYRSSLKDFRKNMKGSIAHVLEKPDVAVALFRYNKPIAVVVNPRILEGMAVELQRLMDENDELYDEVDKLKNAGEVTEEESAD